MRYLCQSCGKFVSKVERHHCFMNRTSNKLLKPYADDVRNIALVCPVCHGTGATGGGMARSYKFKQRYWQQQCVLFGVVDMNDWWDSIPTRAEKERFG